MRSEQLVCGNIRKLLLSCLWHSRQFAIDDSPRTETIPGAGYLVEHSEHVGTKTLVLNISTIPGRRSVCVTSYLGRRSTTVHPFKSKYPARTEFACIRSIRKPCSVSQVVAKGRLTSPISKTIPHFLHVSLRMLDASPELFFRLVTSNCVLHRVHLTVRLGDESSKISIPYISRCGEDIAMPLSGPVGCSACSASCSDTSLSLSSLDSSDPDSPDSACWTDHSGGLGMVMM
jgi:hypothetical protein